MANNHSEIEKRLWASADELRANSKLKSSEYSVVRPENAILAVEGELVCRFGRPTSSRRRMVERPEGSIERL
jgi:hypothetical protein